VHSVDEFERHLDVAVGRIAGFDKAEIHASAQQAGAPNPDEVTDSLLRWMDELPEALSRLRDVIYRT
jgi:hypothetical protein